MRYQTIYAQVFNESQLNTHTNVYKKINMALKNPKLVIKKNCKH